MADICFVAVVVGLGTVTDPALGDTEADVSEGVRGDAGLARDRGTGAGNAALPLVGGEDTDESDQPRDWKGEPD